MAKVVWAYADWTEDGQHDLAVSSFQEYALVASALSWMKYAPNYWRVFYADQSIYDFLKKRGYLNLYNEVILVDFKKELLEKHRAKFFAYPKIWAYTQQESPFFICDTDCILTTNIEEWLDKTKCYGYLYDHTKNLPLGNDRFEPRHTLDSFIDYSNAIVNSPGLRSFCNPVRSVNGGFIYFPDAKKAQALGYIMLSLCKEIQEVQGNWVLFEEALIPTILDVLEMPMNPRPDKACIEECFMGTVEDHTETVQYIEDTIIGEDIQTWYNRLEMI